VGHPFEPAFLSGRGGYPQRAMTARVRLVLLTACVLVGARADAGHEQPFYPSFYPQEIRIETVDPTAAARELPRASLHAYVGRDPFAGRAVPPAVSRVDSLGAYVVVTFNTGPGSRWDRASRCAAAGGILAALAGDAGAYAFHPYPVTPYHPDYLHHFDLAESAKRTAQGRGDGGSTEPRLRMRAKGPVAERLTRAKWPSASGAWDVTIADMEVDDLVSPRRTSLNGWSGPPWLKEGWFHAYLLQSGAVTDATARQGAETLYQRLVTGAYDGLVERLNLERQLVTRLASGCERVVAGYTTRREFFSSEFSGGVENVGYDSETGFISPLFMRTVKLKDFPWNGWLRLGIATRPAAAWNPIGGFTDAAGRLIWSAVGDPASIAAPQSGGWEPNRAVGTVDAGPVQVPADALVPESGTGLLRAVRPGETAAAKIVYRVLASAFHDGSRMTTADVLYPFVFAARWGVPHAEAREYDPLVDSATATVREWLAGLRVLGVHTEVKDYGDVKLPYQVYTVEVYLTHRLLDDRQVAVIAPPWSTLPWPLVVLTEEAVKRQWVAYSAAEARRRGVPWLDLVRDSKLQRRLASLADGFARQAYVPPALRGVVTEAEARERWAALQAYHRAHRHFLITNGPYRLDRWSERAVVLQVFRDLTYPLGIGAFDRYPIPVRAYVSRIEAHGGQLEIHGEVERVQKFQRAYEVVREPLRSASTGDHGDLPECRYLVVGPDGDVVKAGAAPFTDPGVFTVDLHDIRGPGRHAVMVALSLGDNRVNPVIQVASYTRP